MALSPTEPGSKCYGEWRKFPSLAKELQGVKKLPKAERKAALENLRKRWVESQLAAAELANYIEKIILERHPEITTSELKQPGVLQAELAKTKRVRQELEKMIETYATKYDFSQNMCSFFLKIIDLYYNTRRSIITTITHEEEAKIIEFFKDEFFKDEGIESVDFGNISIGPMSVNIYIDQSTCEKLGVTGSFKPYSENNTSPFSINSFILVGQDPVSTLIHEYSHLMFEVYKNAARLSNPRSYDSSPNSLLEALDTLNKLPEENLGLSGLLDLPERSPRWSQSWPEIYIDIEEPETKKGFLIKIFHRLELKVIFREAKDEILAWLIEDGLFSEELAKISEELIQPYFEWLASIFIDFIDPYPYNSFQERVSYYEKHYDFLTEDEIYQEIKPIMRESYVNTIKEAINALQLLLQQYPQQYPPKTAFFLLIDKPLTRWPIFVKKFLQA